ncbi:putative Epididymal secretory glutathione peroxidase-like [Homarus americanus]|uniref:Putative Epididymal secretory glutathione peroxidase-like n=1 Tax=Homarus americanus TaxID=6706 RepID=A0A8J5MVD5_HOMAM|nr:putative Epididymal secretory glutathione peroxidase-like [Homarus americanus]
MGMLWAGLISLAAVGVAAEERFAPRACFHHQSDGGNIYKYEELDLSETRNVSLADYRAKLMRFGHQQPVCLTGKTSMSPVESLVFFLLVNIWLELQDSLS